MIENDDFDPYADADALVAKAGVRKGMLGVGEIAHARASVFETEAGVGGLVGVGAKALSAGAHAEYGLNNSVGADLTVVRGEANVGPVKIGSGIRLDTGAHLGVNGVGASFMGMGFDIGRSMELKTPIFDLKVNFF